MRYDTTLKTLFLAQPPRLLEQLTGAARLKILTIEYPATKARRADLVFARPDGEIQQFELQSGNEALLAVCMLMPSCHPAPASQRLSRVVWLAV